MEIRWSNQVKEGRIYEDSKQRGASVTHKLRHLNSVMDDCGASTEHYDYIPVLTLGWLARVPSQHTWDSCAACA